MCFNSLQSWPVSDGARWQALAYGFAARSNTFQRRPTKRTWKTTNLYVGFDPYFGVTILILAFSVFVYLVFQHNKVVKSRSDLPKNNFIQFQSPSGYLILEYPF